MISKDIVPFLIPDIYRRKPERGEAVSLYGDRSTKIYKFSKDDPDLFESDVPLKLPEFLVDTYTDSDLPSEGHVILTYDIECEMDEWFT